MNTEEWDVTQMHAQILATQTLEVIFGRDAIFRKSSLERNKLYIFLLKKFTSYFIGNDGDGIISRPKAIAIMQTLMYEPIFHVVNEYTHAEYKLKVEYVVLYNEKAEIMFGAKNIDTGKHEEFSLSKFTVKNYTE